MRHGDLWYSLSCAHVAVRYGVKCARLFVLLQECGGLLGVGSGAVRATVEQC